ncbi:MAG: hypothetical protein ACKOPP_04630, partial [Bacteroidota bacterium]
PHCRAAYPVQFCVQPFPSHEQERKTLFLGSFQRLRTPPLVFLEPSVLPSTVMGPKRIGNRARPGL